MMRRVAAGPWITATDASTASLEDIEVERRPVLAFAFAPALASLAPLTYLCRTCQRDEFRPTLDLFSV